MATPLDPKPIRNLGLHGIMRESSVDSSLIPDGAVIEAVNCQFDRIGAVTLRLGIAGLGSTVVAGYSCVGLHNVQSGTIISAFDSAGSIRVFRYTGSAWTSTLSGLTSSSKIRFVDFAKRTILVNGTYDSIRVWDGLTTDTWATTGAPINPDQFASDATVNTQTLRAKFIEVYKSRVYLAGDPTSPDRLFYSSVISTTGNITWTPSTDFVDINPSDGENITALKRFSLELLVFKPNYLYRFRTSGVDPDPLIRIGTRSQESVIEGKRGVYYHHDSGFYRYSGGYPEEISRPINDIVAAIPYTQYDDISAWKDGDHVLWSLGNLTIDGTTWKNVVVRFTESSELWTVYSYPANIQRASTFNSSTALSRVLGLENGVVATYDSGNTDLGEPINYRMITKWYDWGNIYTRKVIQHVVALAEKFQEAQIMYQVDDDTAFRSLGQIRKYINFYDSLAIRFHRIRFKLTGSSRSEQMIFQGLEVIQGINEGVIKEN